MVGAYMLPWRVCGEGGGGLLGIVGICDQEYKPFEKIIHILAVHSVNN